MREALSQTSVRDPELLAQLILSHAEADLEAYRPGPPGVAPESRRPGLDAEVVVVRGLIIDDLNKLRLAAQSILDTPHTSGRLSALEIAIADIIVGSKAVFADIVKARRYIKMLEKLASTPLLSDLSEFAEKPEVDVTTTRIVVAIAEYCRRSETQFSGPPRREQEGNRAVHKPKSYSAKLVKEVLDVLAISYEPQQIATHMKKAGAALRY